jgi:hypothetical protein
MQWTQQDSYRSRRYTCELLDMVEQGMVDKDSLIADLLGWMSESDVAEFARRNDYIQDLDEEDEDESDGQPDEAQEWESFDPDC